MNGTLRNYILWIAVALIIGYLLWFFKGIFAYLVIATIFSLILRPLKITIDKIRIKRFRIPAWLNAMFCLLVLYSVIIAFFSMFIPLVVEQAYGLSNVDPQRIIRNFEEPLRYIEEVLIKYQISDDPGKMVQNYLRDRLSGIFDIANLRYLLNNFVGFTGNLFIAIFSITFITFFFTKNEKLPKQIILGIVPAQYTNKAKRVLIQAESLLTRYFIGLILQITGITLVAYLGLTLIGVQNALLIATFAGFMNIVPYLGPIMGTAFGILVAVSSNLGADFSEQLVPLMLQIVLVFAIVQATDNLVFQPLIFSNSVRAHPLEIFLIILIGGRLAGILGMIAAIPGYTFIRIVAKEFLNEFSVVQKLTSRL